MKKNIIILAAALFAFGMTACTDEPIINPGEGTELPSEMPMVKSASDLIGTEWNYTMEDIAFVDQAGDTMAMLPLSDLVFGLSFDNSHAHFTFPEAVTVINAGMDADGMPTMEELEELAYAYTYDPATETGALTATAYAEDGTPTDVQIPFSYDTTTDAIIIDFNTVIEMTGMDGNAMNVTLVFHRNI